MTMGPTEWNERYASAATAKASVWSLEPNAWLAATLGSLEPGSAVDLGAGEGRNALWLASRGWEVSAVDFSAVGLRTGASRAETLGLDIEWITADATTWVSPEEVDLVVAAYLQLPAADLALALGNAIGYLAPGATIAVIGHDLDNLTRGVGGPHDPAVLYTVDALLEIAAGLDVIECQQYERETAAGAAIDTTLVAINR